ncbi:MAG TPA: phosphatase PAP2 family protein [Rectinemataceae bacterium]|nr:phosphatase PAP2 family protein [Rectinemataceae bacterium]
MDGILGWGLNAVRSIQAFASPMLTSLMLGLSWFGNLWLILLAVPAVYWCVDRRRGARLGILMFISGFVNLWLKLVFAQPRPYDLDQSVALARESTFGLPSGHAQNSLVFYSGIEPLIPRPWGALAAIALPVLIGFSRVYLGVHFPSDVLVGWAIGLIILLCDRLFGDWVERLFALLRERLQLALVAAIALAMNAIDKSEAALTGAFFGFAAGLVYMPRLAPIETGGSAGKRTLRYLFGIGVALGLYALLNLASKGLEPMSPSLVRFVSSAVLGLWLSLGAPLAFIRIGLASREKDEAEE